MKIAGSRKITAVVALAVLLVSVLPALVACDEEGRTEFVDEGIGEAVVCSVQEIDGVAVVRVTQGETESSLGTVPCVIREHYYPDGAFYQVDEVALTVLAEDVRAVAERYFEDNGVSAPAGGLKIFFDYATMNGRITSDGEVAVQDGVYIHTAEENADGALTLNLAVRSAYYIAWYAVAAGVALSALVIAAVAVVCAKALRAKR